MPCRESTGGTQHRFIRILQPLYRERRQLTLKVTGTVCNSTDLEVVVFSNNSEPMTRGTYSRAFVVKFSDQTNLSANIAEGRVEHVSSGSKVEFHSIPQLLAFMDGVLREGPTSATSVRS
jgi:hypothetical protein